MASAVGGRAEGVRVGVAEVDADGVAAVLVERRARPSATRSRASSQPISTHSASAPLPTRRTGGAAGRGRRARRPARRPWGRCSRARAGRRVAPDRRSPGPRAGALDGQLEAADRLAEVADTEAGRHGGHPGTQAPRAGVERAILPQTPSVGRPVEGTTMGYGLGVFLLAIGLIFALAVQDSLDADQPDPDRLDPRRLRRAGDRAGGHADQPHPRASSSVATTTHADGTQTTTEQRTQSDPPPPTA